VFWRSHMPDLIHPRPQRLTYATISSSEPPFDYLQLQPGQSPRYMESCPRFEYLFLATYSSRPTTRPFLGPAVYAATRRTTPSLAGPTHISPPSVLPTRYPAPSAWNTSIFYLRHCPYYYLKTSPQPFSSHCLPLHKSQRNIWSIDSVAIWPL
jgi:hypothetical protein